MLGEHQAVSVFVRVCMRIRDLESSVEQRSLDPEHGTLTLTPPLPPIMVWAPSLYKGESQ